MSSMVSIEIPREVIHATRMTPQELKRELSVYLFQRGRLYRGLRGRPDYTGRT